MFPRTTRNQDRLGVVVDRLQSELNRNGASFVNPQLARQVISMESLDRVAQNELDTSIDGLSHALESIITEFGQSVTGAQRDAAKIAALFGADARTFLTTPVSRPVPAMENQIVVPARGEGSASRMQAALESYDEKENRNMTVYSVAYNLQAARQDEFGEAFFPTVTVSPDQVGYSVSIRLVQVMDEVRRDISGAVSKNFGKRNIIQALIDPSILRNDQTKVVPVYSDESKANFVDAALIPPVAVVHEGEKVTTSALSFGKKFSLLGLSQTEALLSTGILDNSDALDPNVQLSALYMKITDGTATEVVKFDSLIQMPSATFTYAVQGNYRQMNLNMDTNALLVSKNTKQVDGSVSALLAPIVTGEYNVRLSTGVYGSTNLELGDTSLTAGAVSVFEVTDKDGNVLDTTTGVGKTIADLFVSATMIGYDLNARRTNSNRRERGQLLDLTYFNMVYGVNLLAPITIPRPLTVGDQTDSSDLAALITATRIRTSNAAVAKLLEVEQVLKEYVSTNGGLQTYDPEILGAARLLLTPFYEHCDFDVSKQTDSLVAHERAVDIQASLVNKLRDMAYRMWRDSGYQAAADALAGMPTKNPTIIVGTDPVIARWIQVVGDFRTLGNEFNVKVVSTLNQNMRGKIVMTFGDFESGKDGVPNPMHFGNMAWKPELVLVLPLHRNGGNSKELTVQPSFLHVANLPIMASLNVTGISDIAGGKVPVNFHQI